MRTVWLLALLGTVACGGAQSDEEDVGRERSAIISGSASAADDDAVVAIAIRDAGKLSEVCTGTLIAPNLVLTARHCVSRVDPQILCTAGGVNSVGATIFSDYEAPQLSIYLGSAALVDVAADDAQTTRAAAIGRQIFTDGKTNLCNADIALLLLDRDVKGTYAELNDETVAENDKLTAVGFGLMSNGKLPRARQKRDVTVSVVGPYAYTPEAGVGDRELVTSEGACSGDSGGPLFDSQHRVVGVASHVAGGDGTGATALCTGDQAGVFYDRVSKAKDLIDSAIVTAKATPPAVTEPTPSADPASSSSAPENPMAAVFTGKSGGSGGCSSSGGASGGDAFGLFGLLLAIAHVRRRH